MKITNNTNRDMSVLTKTLESFIPYAQKRLEYDRPFQIVFESDEENSKNIFGKTAYYDPATMNVHIYSDGRHDKDMLRSISHEMVHHAQNCRGDFEGAFEMGEGYAQKSPHLRNMEAEAYLLGNGFLVRDFEDSIKMGDNIVQEWKKENKKIITEKATLSKIKVLLQRLIKKAPKEAAALKQAAQGLEGTPLAGSIALVDKNLLDIDSKELVKTASTTKSLLQKGEREEEKVEVKPGEEEMKQSIQKENKEVSDVKKPITKETVSDVKKPITKETIKDHYKIKTKRLYEELMKRFIKKGDK
jgi:hypothetical protein